MNDYTRVQTSQEVFAVIRACHPEMLVFGSFSAPEGDPFGDPGKGRMFSSYGFDGGDCPVIEIQTTWDITDTNNKRQNETHEYWLCIPKREDV
ncbi:hypothetical protein [Caudoviricetes sp.]|nr:hypothetical protein [Caudoviricetes sp.]